MQILEQLHITKLDGTGFCIANDLDQERAFMLASKTNQLNCPYVMVTNHDASKFPDGIKFNKIICDVPCSGDGTTRKNNRTVYKLI